MKKFSKNDQVEWNTSQGKTSGRIIKKVTTSVKVGNYTAKADKANPEYVVELTSLIKLLFINLIVCKNDNPNKHGLYIMNLTKFNYYFYY